MTHAYNPSQRRRVKKSDGTVYWVDDFSRPICLGNTSGALTKDFVFVGNKRIAFVSLASGNPYYYLSDQLGSAAVISSGDGKTIQWEADYFPFGSQRQVFTNLINNSYQFTGYEYDSDTLYNYAVARFDTGRWGRFLGPDPFLGSLDLGNPQSLNRYSYVQNDAINATDPSGLVVINPPSPMPSVGGGMDDDPDDVILCAAFGVGCRQLGGNGGSNSAGGGGTPAAECPAKIVNAINQVLGTNFTPANITKTQEAGLGTAVNIDVNSTGINLTPAQFNAIQPGARWSLSPGFSGQILGTGPSLHIASPSSQFDKTFATFNNSNIGGVLSVQFTAHIDTGNPNRPFGLFIHLFTDVLGRHRKKCL